MQNTFMEMLPEKIVNGGLQHRVNDIRTYPKANSLKKQ